jgi:hypothetical protein
MMVLASCNPNEATASEHPGHATKPTKRPAKLRLGQWIETTTGISLRRFLRLVRPIRTVEIDYHGTRITAEDDIGPQATAALTAIKTGTH